jgi:hypothetical protein
MAFFLKKNQMKNTILLLTIAVAGSAFIKGKTPPGAMKAELPPSIVDFDAFEKLTAEVKEYRKGRLVSLQEFLQMSKEPNTVILDTRSDVFYYQKHVKGALHLNFSDFTSQNLFNVIGSADRRILIYCNNNFSGDQVNFATKMVMPVKTSGLPGNSRDPFTMGDHKPLSLALNIPTFINLYGYGYKNVYELKDLVDVNDPSIEFEGSGGSKTGARFKSGLQGN